MAKLIGRDMEMGLLRKTLNAVMSGTGRTVLISGEAGIGKTRIAEECIELARAMGFRVLRGWCMQGSLEPYVPIREALRSGGLEELLAGDEVPPRLEALYLVSKGGILLAKHERTSGTMDSDIFTGMLTAVTQFIKDSVSQMGMSTKGNVSGIRDCTSQSRSSQPTPSPTIVPSTPTTPLSMMFIQSTLGVGNPKANMVA